MCVFQGWKLESIKAVDTPGERKRERERKESVAAFQFRLFSLAASRFTASLLSHDITFLFGSPAASLAHLHALFLSSSCQCVFY